MSKATKHVDPHVHCRDEEQSAKSTIQQTMELARSQGIVAIIDMPNTKRPVINRERVDERIQLAEKEGCVEGYYLNIGLTANQEQIREAVDVFSDNQRVAGMKDYYGVTTGNLANTEPAQQRIIFEVLTDAGYTGPVMMHCEKETLARPELFIPETPYTWNSAKPPEMEIAAVDDVIKFAIEAGFKGKLHICHISTPKAVMNVESASKEINITCGVTPHHLMLSTNDMQHQDGMKYKVNPPIREEETRLELLSLLKWGYIDMIETDHAPHLLEEKTYDPKKPKEFFMSGIRSLENYLKLLQMLRDRGADEEHIGKLTYSNVKNVFKKIKE